MREFTRLCRELDLFGAQLLAIDGSRFKASNAPDRNWSGPRLEHHLARLQARLDEYLTALDQADSEPSGPASAFNAAELKEKIARLSQTKIRLEERALSLAQSGQTQISTTDPDSRCMRGADGRCVVGYNVQASVDAKHHLIVTAEATNHIADQGQLAAVALAAQQTLQTPRATVVADTGYYKTQDIKTCQDAGLEPHVAAPLNSATERAGLFPKQAFR